MIAEGTPTDLKQRLGGDRVTLRVREFSDAKEAALVRSVLEPVEGVRQVVINRAQGFSLNLVIEGEPVIERLRHSLEGAGLPVFALAQSRPSLDDVYLQADCRRSAATDLVDFVWSFVCECSRGPTPGWDELRTFSWCGSDRLYRF